MPRATTPAYKLPGLPRPPRLPAAFPVLARGPRALQGALFAVAAKPWAGLFAALQTPYPAITEPEAAVYWAHEQLRLVQGEDWDYQKNEAGGRRLFGGIVLDFIDYDVAITISVAGVYWHYQRGVAQLWRDRDVGRLVAKFGYQHVTIDEDDALGDPLYYLREARAGRDHSRLQPGT